METKHTSTRSANDEPAKATLPPAALARSSRSVIYGSPRYLANISRRQSQGDTVHR
jgi:hypothetical protein